MEHSPLAIYSIRVEPTVSFGGPVVEKKLNLCYIFGMADDEESVEKAIMASSKACCEALSLTNKATKSSFRSISWWCPGSGAICSR